MLTRFDSPVKRVGLLVMLFGTALVAIAFTGFLDASRSFNTPLGYFIERFLEGPFRAYRSWGQEVRGWAALLAWVGFTLVVIGATLAFVYDSTIGRVIRWVRTGE